MGWNKKTGKGYYLIYFHLDPKKNTQKHHNKDSLGLQKDKKDTCTVLG